MFAVTKRLWPALAAAATLALAALPLRAEVSEVRISKGFGILYLPLIVMQDQKLLEKQAAKAGLGELKVTWLTIDGGNIINDAMLAGTLDIAGTGAPGFVTLWSKGKGSPRTEVIGVSGLSATSLYLNSNKPEIKSLRDFTEKDRIALPGIKTSLSAVVLQMAVAKEFGRENFSKLDTLTVGFPHPEAVAALKAGKTEITAHFTSPPFSYIELADPKIHRVLSSVDVLGNITLDVVYAPRRFVEANPKLTDAFLAALEEANALIDKDKKAAAEIFVRGSPIKVSEGEVVKMLEDPDTRFSTTPNGVMEFAEFLALAGTIRTRPASWKDLFIPQVHGNGQLRRGGTSMPRDATCVASRVAAGLAFTGCLAGPAAAADGFPSRPITMIVVFAPGGPTDVLARIVADHMGRTLGQRLVVENLAGAGGTTGGARGAKAAPDGYTLTVGSLGSHGAAAALYKNIQYDSRELEPIGLIAGTPGYFVVRKDFPAQSFPEFVAHVRANPGTVTNGHAGVGSTPHLACLYLSHLTGLEMISTPYRGSGPAMNDLVAGQIDSMCDLAPTVVPQIQAGTIRGLLLAQTERSAATPDVPTSKEAGLERYLFTGWNAIFAPKDTPKEATEKLSAALQAALADETVRRRIEDLGALPPTPAERTPEHLRDLVRSDVAKWGEVIREAGFAPQ